LNYILLRWIPSIAFFSIAVKFYFDARVSVTPNHEIHV
jgi:hypothetical protein